MKSVFQNIILPIFAVVAIIFIFVIGGRAKPPQTAQASWSITFDVSSTLAFSKVTTATTTITVGTGADELLVISIAASSTPATGVSVDGHAATKAIATSTTGQDAEIWYYLNATSSATHTVSSTFGANASGTLIISSYFGVNQATPLDATGNKSGNSKAPSSTITTTVANDWIVGMVAFAGGDTASAIGPGQTLIAGNVGNVTEKGIASYKPTTTAVATSTSVTLTASNVAWEEVQAAFEVANTSGYTWTDAAGDNNWNTAGNWSGGAVPGSGNVALFSSSSTANCTINTAVNVAGLTMSSGYTRTITQSSGESITVGTSGFSNASGTFIGSSATTTNDAITVNGPYSLTGGTFKSTAGTLLLTGTADTFSSSIFQNNSGLVVIATSTATITGSSTFYQLQFSNYYSVYYGTGGVYTIATSTILTVAGYFYPYTDNSFIKFLGGGEISAYNNIESGYGPEYATGTVSFFVNGTSSQIIGDDTESGAGYAADGLVLPNLTIQKASTGTVTLAGDIDIFGNFTNASGTTINPGTSTFEMGPEHNGVNSPSIYGSGITATITGSSTFNNLVFGADTAGASGAGSIFTIATGTVLTAQGYFYADDNQNSIQYLGGGSVDIQGNVEAAYAPSYATGTASFFLDGTSTQLISDDTALGSSIPTTGNVILPNLTIQKSTSAAYVEGNVWITGSSTVSQGELGLSTSSNAISFESDGPFTINSGAILSDYPASVSSTIKFGTNITNNGLVFFDGSGEGCTATLPNYISINSTTTGQQVPWYGSGNFIMRYVQVQDQGGTAPITVWNGADNGDNNDTPNGNWNFTTDPEPEIVQATGNSGAAPTTALALPAFGFEPRIGDLIIVPVSARNQTIAAPTDNVGNTYILVGTSTTFGSSPSYALSLYYAKNIVSTSSFVVTVNGNGGSSPMLSARAIEYTGIDPSSTLDAYSENIDTTGSSTAPTSLSATAQSANELYFGTMTPSASTTPSSTSVWTSIAGVTDNITKQALYLEAFATTTAQTIAATWTTPSSTSYAAIMGIFHSPFQNGYATIGTLDSATFDTGVSGGVQLNSIIWQGSTPSNSAVKFQIAVSNSSGGPWTFNGPNGTNTYFCGAANTSIPLVSTNCGGGGSGGYNLFVGYRYFRYRITLWPDSTYIYTPTVSQVVVNWSP
jgi:hypothetical protein